MTTCVIVPNGIVSNRLYPIRFFKKIIGNERDYNHVSDKEYVKFRNLAEEAYSKRQKLSALSQQAYQKGDKKSASELSRKAKEQLSIAEGYNEKAATYVFLENNKDSDDDDIDLHGLYIKEAEYILKQRIISGISKNQPKLDCIVGKGLHSKDGVAKLKPAVEELCRKANLKCWIDEKNAGVLHIGLKNASIPQSWYDINPHGIGAMDDNYFAYHPNEIPQGHKLSHQYNYAQSQPQPQQQANTNIQPYHQQNYHQQQQQQQQQQHNNNNNEEMALALCSVAAALFKCFYR